MSQTRPINKVTATFRDIVLVLDELIVYYCLIAKLLTHKGKTKQQTKP